MANKVIIIVLYFFGVYLLKAQKIEMYFPEFAGKTFDFIIFKGDEQKKVQQGTIPSDGKFSLIIPKEYAPYVGMSRWLLTNSREGGGIDMSILGKDFSVSCTSAIPNSSNILYTDDTANNELTKLFERQDEIISRHDVMVQAKKVFSSDEKNYPVFIEEYKNQEKAYMDFHDALLKKSDYISQFIEIVNITRGFGSQFFENKEGRAKNIADYITNDLNWQYLYTSGHWNTVINSWVKIHTELMKNPEQFAADFRKVTLKIESPVVYAALVKQVANRLAKTGNDHYIGIIAPVVISSGKMIQNREVLDFFTKGVVGTIAPDILVKENSKSISGKKIISLNTKGKSNEKTLLVFYQSDCPDCKEVLRQLKSNYERLKSEKIRIITISADTDKKAFNDTISDFSWQDNYCDFKGVEGENFKNYAVTGAPTIILTDVQGKILSRGASLSF